MEDGEPFQQWKMKNRDLMHMLVVVAAVDGCLLRKKVITKLDELGVKDEIEALVKNAREGENLTESELLKHLEVSYSREEGGLCRRRPIQIHSVSTSLECDSDCRQ